jgi:hypothetical protein
MTGFASLSHLIAYWSYQQPILCSASEEPRPLMPLNERPFGHDMLLKDESSVHIKFFLKPGHFLLLIFLVFSYLRLACPFNMLFISPSFNSSEFYNRRFLQRICDLHSLDHSLDVKKPS